MKKPDTLRRLLRKPAHAKVGPKPKKFTAIIGKTPRGVYLLDVPPELWNSGGWRVGARAWLWVFGNFISITLTPWGPYPSQGRRLPSRLQRVRRRVDGRVRRVVYRVRKSRGPSFEGHRE